MRFDAGMEDPEAEPVKVIIYRREIVDVEVQQGSIRLAAIAGARARQEQPHCVRFRPQFRSRNSQPHHRRRRLPRAKRRKPKTLAQSENKRKWKRTNFFPRLEVGKTESKVFVKIPQRKT